ncbi:MAG: CCA tRNA nucleotidyltransferase [Chitinophagaceae bacterium]|nr:CCA tRNA nucleotidyltransferase [Anaerolineae bacterium]
MSDLLPRTPRRPLMWPDSVLDLQDAMADELAEPLYIVGGAVRDAFLGHPVKDLDLTTRGSAIEIGRQIANRLNGDFYILDSERGVARVLIDSAQGKLVIDIARFRGHDLSEDLHERDFTINAMAVELQSDLTQLIDPLNGEADLTRRAIRRCSPHAISDDPIRALRAVRQSVQFSARMEPETMKDVRAAGQHLLETSAERIRDELVKLLILEKPVAALRIADALGLLVHVVPEIAPLHGLKQSHANGLDAWGHTLSVIEKLRGLLTTISPARTEFSAAVFDYGMVVMALDRYRPQLQAHIASYWAGDRPHEWLLMLAALMHDSGKAQTAMLEEGRWRFHGHDAISAEMAAARANALRLSNDEKQRLVAIVQSHMHRVFWDDLSDLAIHRFWRGLGAAGVDVALLVMADYLGAWGVEVNQDVWIRLVERIRRLLDAYYVEYDRLVAPTPLVDGKLLMESLKLQPGIMIGKLLDAIREAQVLGEIHVAEDAMQFARDYLKNHLT